MIIYEKPKKHQPGIRVREYALVSCSYKLPKTNRKVLVYGGGNNIAIGQYNIDSNNWNILTEISGIVTELDVIAWQDFAAVKII